MRRSELCVREKPIQIDVSGKFWNFKRGPMCDDESNTIFKCIVSGFHALHKWGGGGVPY